MFTSSIANSRMPLSHTTGASGRSSFRRGLIAVAIIIGFVVAGGLVGGGARWWVGGLNGQRSQLHQCVLATQQAHPNENAGSMLPHLQGEVPDCMEAAGYAKALQNKDCSPQLWQGNVYCYEPKTPIGRWLFKLATLV